MIKAMRCRYTVEFKAEAVARVQDQGYTIADVARALGVECKVLDRRMAKARQPAPSAASDSRDAEFMQLREKMPKLRSENDLLKKEEIIATPSPADARANGCYHAHTTGID